MEFNAVMPAHCHGLAPIHCCLVELGFELQTCVSSHLFACKFISTIAGQRVKVFLWHLRACVKLPKYSEANFLASSRFYMCTFTCAPSSICKLTKLQRKAGALTRVLMLQNTLKAAKRVCMLMSIMFAGACYLCIAWHAYTSFGSIATLRYNFVPFACHG